ncbi:M23 family metallopeptidase [Streptomyces sp. NPDC060194]|uniref:M23 family metallopeptidase n=1 Tax=Streptomyces sp. NPDC060194 TaxID=3347069 RepID=UPI003649DCED
MDYAAYGHQDASYGGAGAYGDGSPGGSYGPDGLHGFGHTPDPLFGDYSTTPSGAFDSSSWNGSYPAQDTGAFGTTAHGAAGPWATASDQLSFAADIPAQVPYGPAPAAHGYADAWNPDPVHPSYDTDGGGATGYATGGHDSSWPAHGAQDSGAYDATQWNGADADPYASYAEVTLPSEPAHTEPGLPVSDTEEIGEPLILLDPESPGDGDDDGFDTAYDAAPAAAGPARTPHPAGGRAATRTASRSRRRAPAKRSALFTVAVPSVCVLGAAGIAAASVGTGGASAQDNVGNRAAAPEAVKPAVANNALDTKMVAMDTGARDFGDRANRTQERIDLRERQAAEKKAREAKAAAIEAARPKFALPVAQHGLSAYYGQGGVNWMSLHSGIDFPVDFGTPVMAATDGTVRTQWNGAYGNMAIVTAADGTETWYCHLGSTKIRSGPVKAGDVIAYSGDSGNSTGPHLHFEVRPGGGAAIDPLSWLRGHGLNPT